MRSLEECKAEVFRRSKKKIARRRALIGCVPVVCVLVLVLAWPRPEPVTGGTKPEMETVGQVWMGYQTLQIGSDRTVTDPEKVSNLYCAMEEYFIKYGYVDGEVPDGNCGSVDLDTGTLLVFRGEDGREARFLLEEDRLIKVSTGEVVFLSQEQRMELLEMMEDSL